VFIILITKLKLRTNPQVTNLPLPHTKTEQVKEINQQYQTEKYEINKSAMEANIHTIQNTQN
jgi:hypothetical protein